MTIWLLAVLVLASVAALGFRQGVIRVGFSFIGIFIGVLLARPVGKLFHLIMGVMGVKDPVLLAILPPLIAFMIVSLCFKAGALPVYHKVEVYFKHYGGDLRLALWERLDHRLGLCLGLFNGALYFIIIAWVIYAISYWTVQMSSPTGDPWTLNTLNRLGKDLAVSGFAKVARAIDPLPESYYDTADVAGLIYSNPLLEARVSHYPAFLSLAERTEFQALGSDKSFLDMWQKGEPILNIMKHPPVQTILENADLMGVVKKTVHPNLKDFENYLLTGKSDKYDQEKLVGSWDFDLASTMVLVRRAKPNLTQLEMNRQRAERARAYAQARLIATPEGEIYLKGKPLEGKGNWKLEGDNYQITVGGRQFTGTIQNDRLALVGEGNQIGFVRED
jgi:hypothetical protein